jgi:hypothetical protein
MERERFDGADIAHLLHSRAEDLDWDRLLRRFGSNWRVLFTHLILFGYIYPTQAHRLPSSVMELLIGRLRDETCGAAATIDNRRLCRGTILSRSQYLSDLERWGYRDARLEPVGNMSADEIELWTEAAREEGAA